TVEIILRPHAIGLYIISHWYKMGIVQSTKCLTIATKKTPCPMPQAQCLVFRKRNIYCYFKPAK
ncbi:MAG: hypothetical protein JXR36_04550, partial [Bacteroidales bacterium]|nr:hypothetical protein [Bacteroidales bacterium]